MGSLYKAGERRGEESEGLEPGTHEGARFGARNRVSSPLGSMSAQPAGFNLYTVGGASGKREGG
jgi:hypothetical protein